MDCFWIEKRPIDFTFNAVLDSGPREITDKITIPFDSNVSLREVCFRIMKIHSLPEYVFSDLYGQLDQLIEDYVDDYEANFAGNVLTNHESLVLHVQNILAHEKKADSSSAETRSVTSKESIEESFHEMYHEIVHSGKLTTQLIQLELHNSEVIKCLLQDKQSCLDILAESIINLDQDDLKQITDIHNALSHEEEVWSQKISNVRRDQKREFRSWIKNTYEDYVKHQNTPANNSFDSDNANRSGGIEEFVEFMPEDEIHFEESYTINLGAQLKTTHNLRLISVDILKFCSTICTPHRIQTAMSLYSNSLSAIVLLVDKDILNQTGIHKDFHKLCMSSSENHFPELKVQLDDITAAAYEKRGINDDTSQVELNAGDVFVTRHSNLSEAHIVFHLVTDDSLKHQEISSRHPVILGIRNIIKMAYLYDIANISIPLLLIHHMVEDCTIQWCMKRAELVVKCIKGFMIELSSLLCLAENENKTLQFVVPREISHDLFNSLSSILPTVFRVSNALVLTNNS